MKRLYDFTPGQVAIVQDNYFATVWAKWEKVGQHQRTWYLVANSDAPRPSLEFVPEGYLELLEEVQADKRRITFQEVEEEYSHRCVMEASDPLSDFGTAYGVATLFDGTREVGKWSVATDGSGYPWWLIALKEDMVVADSWGFFGKHHAEADFADRWTVEVRNSPRLLDVVK